MNTQLDFRPKAPGEEFLQLTSRAVPLRFIRNEKARRYVLRVSDEGWARVTVPRRGSVKAAREFLERNLDWLEEQVQKREHRLAQPACWMHGTRILFRGQHVRLQVDPLGRAVQFGDQFVAIGNAAQLRAEIELHLRKLAENELVPRTWEFAALHRVTVARVSVRSQRSRWGSCSTKRTISLNWHLIQTPEFVRDYIILHELMHLREMNHSSRFWQQVESVCPGYKEAEAWLNKHEGLLRGRFN